MTATDATRLAWPAVGMEAAAAALMQEAPKAQKLDAAMSVLTSLLVDLENELKAGDSQPPYLGNRAPGLPVTPPAPLQPVADAGLNGVLDRTDKLDSALNVLTRQLAQLEEELRGGPQDTTPPPRLAAAVTPSKTSSRRRASPSGTAAERIGLEVTLASPETKATALAPATSPSPPMKPRAVKAPATASELDENQVQAHLAAGKQTPGARLGVGGPMSARETAPLHSRREQSRGGGTTPTVPRPAGTGGSLGGLPPKVQPPAPPSQPSQALPQQHQQPLRRSLLQQQHYSSQEQPSRPRLQQSHSLQPPVQQAQPVQPLQPVQALQQEQQQQQQQLSATERASPQHGKSLRENLTPATAGWGNLAAPDTTQAANNAANSVAGWVDGAPFAIPLSRERSASPVTHAMPCQGQCQGLSKPQPQNRSSSNEAAAYPLTRSQTPCAQAPGNGIAATPRPGMPSAVASVAMASVAPAPISVRPPQGGQSPIRCLSPSACPASSHQQAAPTRFTSAPNARQGRRGSQSPLRWNNQSSYPMPAAPSASNGPENMYSNSQVGRSVSIDNNLMQIGRPVSG